MSEESEKKESDYERAPQVPSTVSPLFEAVMAVQAGKLTVAEAARQVGLSRNRFQTRMHRALRGFITELQDKPQGRPPKPEREAELEKELDALKKENAKLKSRVDTVDRLLGVASDLVKGKLTLSGRSRQTGAEPAAEDSRGESDEPDGEAREKLAGVRVPGIIRGFDAMHVGENFLLVAADASVSYRTLLKAVQSYDSQSVAAALELDIALNGAPLVYRMDRAKCHQTAEVQAVLDAHGVLLLHGPPRHPCYYGQLERQNREHRAWLNVCGYLDLLGLEQEAARMKYAWNCSLPRRTLSWKTASEVWSQRAVIEVDRQSFKDEVNYRAARIQRQLEARGEHAGMAERLAIEATLTKHGWLLRSGGAEC